jgi:hypothetical protein
MTTDDEIRINKEYILHTILYVDDQAIIQHCKIIITDPLMKYV